MAYPPEFTELLALNLKAIGISYATPTHINAAQGCFAQPLLHCTALAPATAGR